MFCAVHAPAKLAAYELLPPRELSLAAEVSRVRERWNAMQNPSPDDEDTLRSVASWPGRALFDALVHGLRADVHRKLETVSTSYDPQLSPQENLPGGQMSATQRQFVERIWQPIVRPRLASAGFWQVATI
jgi:hypothetical protein